MNSKAVEEITKKAISNKVFPGCAVGVLEESGETKIFPFGTFTYEANSPSVTQDTVYDTASITKTIPVALIALTFIEKGDLKLDDHIVDYLPEIQIENADKGLIRHLLTYTYVLRKNVDPNFSYEYSKAKDVFDFLFKREFEYIPGTHYQYANTAANLLGIILERISGEKLYDLAQRIVLDPLGMKNSTFFPRNKVSIPPTEIVSWRGEIRGEVHDETASILQKEGFNPGCAGLFSTAENLLRVAEMILQKGSYKGRRMFAEETVSLMMTNAVQDIGASCGMGWELNQPKFMGSYAHEHMIGKTGFTGTCIVIDPRSARALVTLSNRTYPKRSQNADAINSFRTDIADIVFKP